MLSALADYFEVPIDYLTGNGLYQYFDDIVANKEAIVTSLVHARPKFKVFEEFFYEVDDFTFVQAISKLISDFNFETVDGKTNIKIFFR